MKEMIIRGEMNNRGGRERKSENEGRVKGNI
jgi:hypothetical protein